MPSVICFLAILYAAQSKAPPDVSFVDLERFQCKEVAWDYYYFAERHKVWLQGRMDFSDTRAFMSRWQNDAEECRRAWDALADAWGPINARGYMDPDSMINGEEWRMTRLRDLRKLLGNDAYYKGLMPPPVPLWYFTDGIPPEEKPVKKLAPWERKLQRI